MIEIGFNLARMSLNKCPKIFLKLKKLLRLDKKKSTETEEKNEQNKEEDQESTATQDDNKEKAD